MKAVIVHENFENVKSDLLVNFLFSDLDFLNESVKYMDLHLNGKTGNITKIGDFKGKPKDISLIYTDGALKTERILLCGLGESKKLSLEVLRKAAGRAIGYANKLKVSRVALFLEDLQRYSDILSQDLISVFQAIVEGMLLSQYKFSKYIHSEEKENEIREIQLVLSNKIKSENLKKTLTDTIHLCEAVVISRDLVNAPSNEIDPISFSEKAKEYSREYGFKATILKKKEIELKKMGGLLAVSQGSTIPPRFVILEHNIDKVDLDTIVLVGKGVTFDSGGISLKPANNMWEMRMDMSGAAAVLGTIVAAARLKIPLRIIGLIPLAENMPGGSAQKPGDIITISNGKTVEVDNTDAEGRLILADALVYAAKYKPTAIIDLATLTGAVVVALGHFVTGMIGNDEQLKSMLVKSGLRTYERVWELPMFDEYDELIKSDFADVKNVGGKWGGAITAAMFLKKFTSNFPWVHLDIAGTAAIEKDIEYIPKGGTGVGVRLLIDLFKNWKK